MGSSSSSHRLAWPFQIIVLSFAIGVLSSLYMQRMMIPTGDGAASRTSSSLAARPTRLPFFCAAGLRWILVQHFPMLMATLFSQSNDALWAEWENEASAAAAASNAAAAAAAASPQPLPSSNNNDHCKMDIPIIDVRDMMIRFLTPVVDNDDDDDDDKKNDPDNNNNNHRQHLYDSIEIRIAQYVSQQMGTDWRRRPLLFKGLWSPPELLLQEEEEEEDHHHHHRRRRLSLAGLLDEPMVVPYYYDATTGAVTPDAIGRIQDIVANMTMTNSHTTTAQKLGPGEGGGDGPAAVPSHHPHKIATQLLLQKYPALLDEVIPPNKRGILTALLGDYFQPRGIVGSGPFQLFPALTTVPLFVAGDGGSGDGHDDENEKNDHADPTSNNNNNRAESDSYTTGTTATSTTQRSIAGPYTPLHSEPICNLAVQLAGRKHWTLVDARHWRQLRPTLAADGRAFVESKRAMTATEPTHRLDGNDDDDDNPSRHCVQQQYKYCQGTTESGDALWLPAWTWHRVDYHDSLADRTSRKATTTSSSTISIGASVFHFRFDLFVRQNPVLALAVIPALIRELLGRAMQ